MLRALKSDQRLIETLRLPIGLLSTPVTPMCRKTVNKLMPPPILRRLIGITCAWCNSWGAKQRQTKCLVVRLVRTVLGIRKYSDAKRSASICQIEPLMRRHFKFPLVIVTTLYAADVQIVSRIRI